MPQAKTSIFDQYIGVVADIVNGKLRNPIIVDVGGGRQCPFAHVLNHVGNTTILAVDISEDEIKQNNDVTGKLVADIAVGLPFASRTVDLITSRSVLEHIEDVSHFVMDASDVLKADGYWVHLFPSRFAPFALINQSLPKFASRALVHFFVPESKGICGFPAFYNRCYHSAIRNLLLKNGFELVDVKLGYYQSAYYAFCFPLFALSAAYEMLIKLLGLKNLAAYLLVVARRAKA